MKIDVAAMFGQHCITSEDGEQLHSQISDAVQRGEHIEVNFTGATVFASPFFNAMVGSLLKDHAPDELNSYVMFSGLSSDAQVLIRRVIKNSREYFSNPDVRQKLDELNAERGHEKSGEHTI